MHEEDAGLGNLDATLILQRLTMSPHKEVIETNLCELPGFKAKTHKKVDSLGENPSIAAHIVILPYRNN